MVKVIQLFYCPKDGSVYSRVDYKVVTPGKKKGVNKNGYGSAVPTEYQILVEGHWRAVKRYQLYHSGPCEYFIGDSYSNRKGEVAIW